jgi:beta-carotene 3-hydroxylase
VTTVAVFVLTVVAMEGLAYAVHRWVMHGRGMVWHASHHRVRQARFERNDLFPLLFSSVGVALFVLAAIGVAPALFWPTAAGVTAYGVAYLGVHEVVIHRRLPLRVPESRYLRWLRDSHRAHHVDAGEPYGMLLPLMRASDRERVVAARQRESDDDLLCRSSTRPMRKRL